MRPFNLAGTLALFILFFGLSVSAQTIVNYAVKNPVNMNDPVTIYGLYTGTDASTRPLCDFYFLDNDTNYLIDRATSEYMSANGVFSTQRLIQNPPYKQDMNVRALTVCGAASAQANFKITHPASKDADVLYWLHDLNFSPIWFFAIVTVVILGVAFLGYLRNSLR